MNNSKFILLLHNVLNIFKQKSSTKQTYIDMKYITVLNIYIFTGIKSITSMNINIII